MILIQQHSNGKAVLARGQGESARPAVLPDRGDQLLGALGGQTIVRGAQAAAGAFALVLEANAPVGAWDAVAIGFDADGPEGSNFLLREMVLPMSMPLLALMVRQCMPS